MIRKEFTSVKRLFIALLMTVVPVILILILKSFTTKYNIFWSLINTVLFLISVDIASWINEKDIYRCMRLFLFAFINSFWFLLVPFGAIIYTLLILTLNNIHNKYIDNSVFMIVIDKILFFINIVPCFILAILLAFTGNFELVARRLLQKRGLEISYLKIETMLFDLLMLSIKQDNLERENEDMLVATTGILYRSSIFLLCTTAICSAFN